MERFSSRHDPSSKNFPMTAENNIPVLLADDLATGI
jgi:hypothetical protein